MKKYLQAGILLGTVMLAGCNVNEEKVAIPTTKQTVEDEPLADTDKSEVKPKASLKLTEEQKEDYYKEYVILKDNIVAKYEGFGVDVVPMNEFLPEDWVEPEEFEKRLIDRANIKIIVSKSNDISSPELVTKTVNFHIGSSVRTISISGSFKTQYSPSDGGMQFFSRINSISSQAESEGGVWEQKGYDYRLINDDRTYIITIGGKYSQSGISSSHHVEVEFDCTKNGGVN
ncbi:hypothetical protein [Metabacillus fastidiosus]|uniref:hypothetical protein n=1 Tax=Metabacillus fastidiosus TaxID=1458 RepID=UPI002E1D1BED|nr:hypothetical protein [Metabacillus fastidiosus]